MLGQRIPQRVGRFKILELMHPTTCGTLYHASAAGDDREFALLLANDAATGASPAASSFYARAHMTARFSHVNVARILEIDKTDGVTFVACELPPGRGLDTLRERGVLGREEALHILAQLATALDTAHETGLFHGSLTPADVWIGPNSAGTDRWHVTLLGLGISWLSGGAPEQDLADHEYLAPERRNPDRWAEVGAASDVYSYAALARQLLGLHLPDRDLDGTTAALRNALEPALADDPRARPARADAVFAGIRSRLAPPTVSLLPGTSGARAGGTTLPVAQVIGLSAIAIMLVLIVFLAGQRLLSRFNTDPAGATHQTGDPPIVQIAALTQPAQEGSTNVRLVNTPVDPTNTPRPSVTPFPTAVPRPNAMPTPRPLLVKTIAPTEVIPTDTPVPAPSRTPNAVRTATRPASDIPTLSAPPTGATANRTMTFSWRWNGSALAANQGFEVRIWKEGQTDHYGAASPVRETSQEIHLENAYGIQRGGDGTYFWTVALVQLDPYMRIGQEATPRTMVIYFSGSLDDGKNPTPVPGPPTLPPLP